MAIIEKKSIYLADKLPIEQGTSASGKAWSRQTLVLKEYPKESEPITLAATAMGLQLDKINNFNYAPGDHVDVTLAISSREWKGKWYTECIVREISCTWKDHAKPNMAMEKERAENAAYKERYYAEKAREEADDDYLQKQLEAKFGKMATDMSPKGEQSEDLPF